MLGVSGNKDTEHKSGLKARIGLILPLTLEKASVF